MFPTLQLWQPLSCYSLQKHISVLLVAVTLLPSLTLALGGLHCYMIFSAAQLCKKRTYSRDIARCLLECAVCSWAAQNCAARRSFGMAGRLKLWPHGSVQMCSEEHSREFAESNGGCQPTCHKEFTINWQTQFSSWPFFTTTVSDICDSLRQDESICVDLESDFNWDKKPEQGCFCG